MSVSKITLLYGAVLHVCGLAALTVLVAIGKVPSSEGLPLIAGLLGLGAGVAVTTDIPPEPSGAVLAPVAAPVALAAAPNNTATGGVNAMPTNQV